ncbi:MAG: SH3 domain-containing protein [Chloroflexi bacterium]|uniref:SH3 domain-containing protein n=1 Tax=Candidatus Flexifilum breve TaxID=3140694 RepID=UPI00313497C3|nr:SH3 domain-containing protein [Chloroflexota bacterium]
MPQATATEVPTRVPARQAVLPTITPTLVVTATPLVQATAVPTTGPSCALLTIYNLNLRAEPSADAALLTTIPFSTTLTAYEVNTDGWWRVDYAGQTGWVSGEYVSPPPRVSR